MSTSFLLYLSLLVAVSLTGLFNFKKLDRSFKLLTVFILVTFISELTTRYFALAYRNSSPVYPIYIPIQYFFLTAFYSFHLQKGKTIIAWSWVAFTLMVFINAIFFQSIWTFSSNNVLVSSLVYVACSLFLFKKMLSNIEEKSILKQELFWYNTSNLVLYLFSFFCWSFYNLLLAHGKVGALYKIIYYLVLQNYIITGIAIYLNSRNKNNEGNAG